MAGSSAAQRALQLPEIVRPIFDQLHPVRRFYYTPSPMYCLVNRLFCQIGQEYLWQRLRINPRDDGGFPWEEGDPSTTDQRLIEMSSLRRACDPSSTLGSMVRSVIVKETLSSELETIFKHCPNLTELYWEPYVHGPAEQPAPFPMPPANLRVLGVYTQYQIRDCEDVMVSQQVALQDLDTRVAVLKMLRTVSSDLALPAAITLSKACGDRITRLTLLRNESYEKWTRTDWEAVFRPLIALRDMSLGFPPPPLVWDLLPTRLHSVEIFTLLVYPALYQSFQALIDHLADPYWLPALRTIKTGSHRRGKHQPLQRIAEARQGTMIRCRNAGRVFDLDMWKAFEAGLDVWRMDGCLR